MRVIPKKTQRVFLAKEEEDFTQTEVCCMGAHPVWGTLSRRGLNPIKLAYNPSRALLTASACNRLGQYANSPGNRAQCYAELTVSSLAVAVTIASTHYAYPQRDGQAEWAWVAWLDTKMVYQRTVSHLSINPAWRRVTLLIRPWTQVHQLVEPTCTSLAHLYIISEPVDHQLTCTLSAVMSFCLATSSVTSVYWSLSSDTTLFIWAAPLPIGKWPTCFIRCINACQHQTSTVKFHLTKLAPCGTDGLLLLAKFFQVQSHVTQKQT